MVVIENTNELIHTKPTDNEKVIMSLRGRMAEIMCMIALDIYQPYVQFERGKSVVYPSIKCYIWDTKYSNLILNKSFQRSS